MSIHKKEYDTLLTDEKRRRERNIRLLAKLENIEKKASFLQAKTDRIKSLKTIYKSKFDPNGIPICYSSRDERMKYPEGNPKIHDIKNKNYYYDKYFDLREPYDAKSPKDINSCYITKNITLEEAIEEISRRYVLIPKTQANKNKVQVEKSNPVTSNDFNIDTVPKFEFEPITINKIEPEKIVTQNKVDFKIDNLNEDEFKEIEMDEPHSKEFDCVENKEKDLSEIEFQNMQIHNEEEIYENNVLPVDVSQEVPETIEIQPASQIESANSKLKNLSSEIAHIDQMGLEEDHIGQIGLEDQIGQIELEDYTDQNNTMSQELDNVKYTEELIENEKPLEEMQQQNEISEELHIQNTNSDETLPEHLNQNPNENEEYFTNQHEQGNNEYVEPTIDQQQYESNDGNYANNDQQQPLEQYESNDGNYTNETPNEDNSNYDQADFYNTQATEENVSNEPQYYENPDYDQNIPQENYANDQNQYNAENAPQYEEPYDQNQVSNTENYAYDDTEQVTNEYGESDAQGDYQNHTEQSNIESEQYNNYEQQEDSQYYDETTAEESPVKDFQPDVDDQNSDIKPLQILDSDTDPVSVKEETSVQESDFDFSTQ